MTSDITATVLVATWRDGLFVVGGETSGHELGDQSVRALAPDGHRGALGIVNGRSLRRRAPDGMWSTIATTKFDLACCVAVGDVIYVGTDDARVLRLDAEGALEPLRGFDVVAGRETWYAGSAVINGQRVGPPLGIRSITAAPDGAVLLANVHVGGVPRSTDGGATWQPHHRRRQRRPRGSRAPESSGGRDGRRGDRALHQPRRWLDMGRRTGGPARLVLLCRRVCGRRCPRVRIVRPLRAAGRDLPTADRWTRSSGSRRRRPAPMDRRHCRHRLYCYVRLRSRDRRSERQPLLVRRHRPQLVDPDLRLRTPEQRPHRLSAKGGYCLRARLSQI